MSSYRRDSVSGGINTTSPRPKSLRQAIENYIDLSANPITGTHSEQRASLVSNCHRALAELGAVSLTDFLTPNGIETALHQVRQPLQTQAYHHHQIHNIYFQDDVAGIDPTHAALRRMETANRKICADQIPESLLVALYHWPPFIQFLADILEYPALYTMADPLASLNVMAYGPEERLSWHFDRAVFTVTLMLQAADRGGQFQYVRNLRSENDPNYAGVAALLNNNLDAVETLPMTAGTLNIFKGVYTAHRVTPVTGRRERIVAILSYFAEPGVQFSASDQKRFYGRQA